MAVPAALVVLIREPGTRSKKEDAAPVLGAGYLDIFHLPVSDVCHLC